MIEKIVIVEDEKLNADRLKRLISEINPNVKIIAVLDSVMDTIEWFKENDEPDVVMMDIRLSDGVSFDIFEKVAIQCPIIFTTAYDEYAVQAFKYNSVDYILKPVEKEELHTALNKVDDYKSKMEHQLSIDKLISYVKQKEYRTRFLVPFRDGFQTILVTDLSFIYMDMKLTKARLKNGKDVVLNLSLDDLEKQLDPKFFFRANRQFIIHVDSVDQLVNYFNRKLKVILFNADCEVIVSREKSNLLKEWLDS
ncbi:MULTISPECIES: LytR/AlgR family response regulator transcription factor [Sphingobacterium]|jgi:two-component system response regulator LytT|uniref:LytR/AlgR family response regulator transcription factor n=1 Tax=Sphingobacterium TaxID=28453 RepID=UPI00200DFF47|nr:MULTISPECIES: LytTR family DNA-binding domain-containing protein [Sphingobacterium]UPZ36377.1 LytTR family DNA-binding domain-containing protein [Sphingobacterium sp. PCS056]UXD67979.1 LytTR family DNA-binding domain-containing protein [Sphingobacterium faecium]WGQ15685.1 LytTR family DNA-binding domain-containing protein [Sphingobacterium faecium]